MSNVLHLQFQVWCPAKVAQNSVKTANLATRFAESGNPANTTVLLTTWRYLIVKNNGPNLEVIALILSILCIFNPKVAQNSVKTANLATLFAESGNPANNTVLTIT